MAINLSQQVKSFLPTVPKTTLGAQQPQTGGMMTKFSPQQNLIGTQINPVGSQRGQAAAGMTDRAANAVGNYQFQGFKPVTANTSQSQGIYDNLLKMAQGSGSVGIGGGSFGAGATLNSQLQPYLDKITNAPDRGKLATDMYGVLEERAKPQFEQRLRSVGQRAAALGRVGAGLTTNDLTDVETQHNQNLDLSRRQLAAEGAGQTLDDYLKQLGAAKDVYGSVANVNAGAALGAAQMNRDQFNNLLTLGRDIYGRESDTYGRNVGERDSGLNYDQTRFGNTRNQLGDLSIYEQDIYGRDRDSRSEYRGERDYQYGLERDALGDRERAYDRQERAYGDDWNRAMEMAQFGYGQNPAGAIGAQGARQDQQAQSTLDSLGPLFLEWARKNRGGSAPQPQPTPYDDAMV